MLHLEESDKTGAYGKAFDRCEAASAFLLEVWASTGTSPPDSLVGPNIFRQVENIQTILDYLDDAIEQAGGRRPLQDADFYKLCK